MLPRNGKEDTNFRAIFPSTWFIVMAKCLMRCNLKEEGFVSSSKPENGEEVLVAEVETADYNAFEARKQRQVNS